MSGYKNTGMTQAVYQAFLAHATFRNLDPDGEAAGDEWETLPSDEQERWFAVAEAVRDDTRGEPRY